jgi:hypothetical protein
MESELEFKVRDEAASRIFPGSASTIDPRHWHHDSGWLARHFVLFVCTATACLGVDSYTRIMTGGNVWQPREGIFCGGERVVYGGATTMRDSLMLDGLPFLPIIVACRMVTNEMSTRMSRVD